MGDPGLDHQMSMPEVARPEDLPTEVELRTAFDVEFPDRPQTYWNLERPIEIRPVDLDHYWLTDKLAPVQNTWLKPKGLVPPRGDYQMAILAFMSDTTILDTSLFAHGCSIFDPGIQAASLDHAIWFHRNLEIDDWLLYAQDSPSASQGRGMGRGCFFTRAGVLVASVVQEGLIRYAFPPSDTTLS